MVSTSLLGHHPAHGRALATLAHCRQWAALVGQLPDLVSLRPGDARKARAAFCFFLLFLPALYFLLFRADHLTLHVDDGAGAHFPEFVRADPQVKRVI